MNQIDLEGQIAVITGGAQYWPRLPNVSWPLAAVCLWDKDAALLGQTVEKLSAGSRVFGVSVDVTDPQSIKHGVKAVTDAYGGVSIMVNNAGIAALARKPVEYEDDEWASVIDLDLSGVFYCCRAVISLMREAGYGRIVNVASIAGKEGNQTQAHTAQPRQVL